MWDPKLFWASGAGWIGLKCPGHAGTAGTQSAEHLPGSSGNGHALGAVSIATKQARGRMPTQFPLGGPELWFLRTSLWSRQPRRTQPALPGRWRRTRLLRLVFPRGGSCCDGKGFLSLSGGSRSPGSKEWFNPSKSVAGGLGFRPQEEGGLARGQLAPRSAVRRGPRPPPLRKAQDCGERRPRRSARAAGGLAARVRGRPL